MVLREKFLFKACLIISFLVIVSSQLFLLTSEAHAICVKASIANLRNGPGTNYQKMWEVYKYMPFRKLGEKGNWFRVKDIDGDIHWIHKKLVTRSYKCAAVKTAKANFRTGPGTRYPQVKWSPMGLYFSMKILKSTSNWLKIMDSSGDVAWVHRSLIWIQ